MLAAAALGARGAQLAQIRAAKRDWFVGAGRVDKQDVSLEPWRPMAESKLKGCS